MVIVGLVTLLGLPIAHFPKVVPPEIFIQANYVGADAQTIEQSLATPIEQQMSGVDSTFGQLSFDAKAATSLPSASPAKLPAVFVRVEHHGRTLYDRRFCRTVLKPRI